MSSGPDKIKYSDDCGGVHYVRHENHCENGCYVIVECSRFWSDGPQPCIICEGAKRNVPLKLICELLDEHYLNTEVSDPAVLALLVPKYIERWENLHFTQTI
uniref:Uncharacterized protein n=1 Tax=Marseillevirus LCMAC101 TaxID=2506602 RepID=A0A481YTB5_9VIRU|nr:MAG: hypothetical protein LCMAC101_03390 [Marseillevirus LCMAC101]